MRNLHTSFFRPGGRGAGKPVDVFSHREEEATHKREASWAENARPVRVGQSAAASGPSAPNGGPHAPASASSDCRTFCSGFVPWTM